MLDRSEEIGQLATRVFVARHFCTRDVLEPTAEELAREALLWMEVNDFDLAPVAGTNGALVIHRDTLRAAPPDTPVGGLATPTPPEHWVDATASLRLSLELLANRPWLLVRDDGRLGGVLTRSDLASPVVSSYLLARLLGMERCLRRLYGTYTHQPIPDEPGDPDGGDGWTLSNVLNRIAGTKELRHDLGEDSRKAFERFASRVIPLRNRLAHGGSILTFVRDPGAAIALVESVETFVAKAHGLVAQREAIWRTIANTTIVESGDSTMVWAGMNAIDLPVRLPVHVITGQNPHEKVLTADENQRRHRLLGRYIAGHPKAPCLTMREVIGRSNEGPWAEDSWAICGLERDEALRICRYFGQRAIFELTASEVRVIAADGTIAACVPRDRPQ